MAAVQMDVPAVLPVVLVMLRGGQDFEILRTVVLPDVVLVMHVLRGGYSLPSACSITTMCS